MLHLLHDLSPATGPHLLALLVPRRVLPLSLLAQHGVGAHFPLSSLAQALLRPPQLAPRPPPLVPFFAGGDDILVPVLSREVSLYHCPVHPTRALLRGCLAVTVDPDTACHLAQCRALRALTITGCCGAPEMDHAVGAIQRCPVEAVVMHNVPGDAAARLLTAAAQRKELHTVRITASAPPPVPSLIARILSTRSSVVSALRETALRCGGVTTLDLSGVTTAVPGSLLAALLTAWSQLRWFNVAGALALPGDWPPMEGAMLSCLTHLDVSDCPKLSSAGLGRALLACCASLRSLECGGRSAVALSEWLLGESNSAEFPALRSVGLCHAPALPRVFQMENTLLALVRCTCPRGGLAVLRLCGLHVSIRALYSLEGYGLQAVDLTGAVLSWSGCVRPSVSRLEERLKRSIPCVQGRFTIERSPRSGICCIV